MKYWIRRKSWVASLVVLALAFPTALETSAQEVHAVQEAGTLQEELASAEEESLQEESLQEESLQEESLQEEKAEETSGRAMDRLLVAVGSLADEIALLEASSGQEPSKVLIWDAERAIRGDQESAALLGEALIAHQEQVLALQNVLGRHGAVKAGLEEHGIRAREVIAAHALKGGYLLLFVSAEGVSAEGLGSNTSSVEVHDAAEDPQ